MSHHERGRAARSKPPPVGLHVHPPERRRRSVIVASPSCCCCCCCCLHTVGGLVGAGIASAKPTGRFAARLYWQTLGILVGVGVFLGMVYSAFVEKELAGGALVVL